MINPRLIEIVKAQAERLTYNDCALYMPPSAWPLLATAYKIDAVYLVNDTWMQLTGIPVVIEDELPPNTFELRALSRREETGLLKGSIIPARLIESGLVEVEAIEEKQWPEASISLSHIDTLMEGFNRPSDTGGSTGNSLPDM